VIFPQRGETKRRSRKASAGCSWLLQAGEGVEKVGEQKAFFGCEHAAGKFFFPSFD